jgi:hypothetical protein
MLGYTEATIARKAEKRNLTVDEYKKVLIEKRQTRSKRRAEARKDRAAEKVNA